MNKPLNWFEIPAADLERARIFYEIALGITLETVRFENTDIAVFPCDRERATGGCLLSVPGHSPAANGPILYLNAGDSLDAALERAQGNGGKLVLARTALPSGMGFYAHITDSEGNRIGLHGLN